MSVTPSGRSDVTHNDDFFEMDDEELTLNIKNEDEEIARLQLPPEDDAAAQPPTYDDDERIAKIEFHCVACDMQEMVHHYGREVPFVEGIQFMEDTYVMRDPFQAPPPRRQTKPEYFIALGAKCNKCAQTVCKDAACSFYYTRTFCLRCAAIELKSLPVEAQAKLRKHLAEK